MRHMIGGITFLSLFPQKIMDFVENTIGYRPMLLGHNSFHFLDSTKVNLLLS